MAAPTKYQDVVTATDYALTAEDGTPFKVFLTFNGTNQWLQTNSIDFSYGDKMFVSAGVRNLNSSLGIYAELSTAWGSNNGAFVHYQESNATNAAASKGTATGIQAQSAFSSIYATPNTIVSTSTHDIAGDLSALRINGSASGTNGTADKGVGNFGNYPMFLGARAGTSLWANIRFYGLVVAGKQASAAEITSTETYLNQKTGAF